jgi:hypothetical protein
LLRACPTTRKGNRHFFSAGNPDCDIDCTVTRSRGPIVHSLQSPEEKKSDMSKLEETAVYGLSSRGNSKVSGCTYDDLHSARTLLSPHKMRGLELRNRVVLAPLTRSRAGESRMPNKMMAEHYMQRASAGMIVTESVHISEQGIGWLNSPGIYTDEQAEAWKEVSAPVQAQGTPMFIQLWHMGRASHESFRKDRSQPVAPSAIAINSNHRHTPEGIVPYPVPRALETDEIAGVVEQ